MNKIFIPASKPEDWRPFLAKPRKHWKTGYSAKALAYCWQEADGFPESVRRVFAESGFALFQNIEFLLAFPEYKVSLPGGRRASQSDVFVLARGNNQLISIMVEGKVSESFGETVGEWLKGASEGKEERLEYLLGELQIKNKEIVAICYQLLHRTASAVIEAKKFNAENALVLVHSFSQADESFKDYARFAALCGVSRIVPNSLELAKSINGINLYFSWIRGDKKYLHV
jgi:hypothetical protein